MVIDALKVDRAPAKSDADVEEHHVPVVDLLDAVNGHVKAGVMGE